MRIDGIILFCVAAFFSGGLLPAAAEAHRLDVWAYVDDNGYIQVETQYGNGEAVPGALVEVSDPEGTVLARGRTDAEGKYRFTLSEVPKHINIVAKTGDGHKGSITLAHDGLKGAVGKLEEAPPAKPAAAKARTHSDANSSEIMQKLARQEELLREIRRELELLKKPRTGVSMEQVLAGIGFIVGLTGVAAYCLARRDRGG